MTDRARWVQAVTNGETDLGLSQWIASTTTNLHKEDLAGYQKRLNKLVDEVFGTGVSRNLELEDTGRDLTIVLNANTAMICPVEIVVPDSCNERQARELAELLKKEMDPSEFEPTDDCWEELEPMILRLD